MEGFSRLPLFLLPVLLFSMLQRPTFAIKKSYVVYLGSHSHGPEITQSHIDLASNSHYEFLSDFVGGTEQAKESIFYSYTKHINGFAATLEEEKAAEIAKHPRVISVFPNQELKLHTTRSWDFLGLEKNGKVQPGSIWEKANFGEDIIIANLDSGVWPESKSFSDEGYGPIPSRWKGGCTDTGADAVRCNRKLIGAKAFKEGPDVVGYPIKSNTTRDLVGHGTHSLSTAAGNFVQNANLFGLGNGTSKGGSPRARVASYNVCTRGCLDADVLAGFDAAIHDGVDILSLSIGNPRDYLYDGMAIGSFHAVRNGVLVVAAGGNDGPEPGTIGNVAPWLFTVAASTMDRQFSAYVKLGNNKNFKGDSLSSVSFPSDGKMYPLVSGAAARAKNASEENGKYCVPGSLDPELVKGKILMCFNKGLEGIQTGPTAISAGAVGIIFVIENNYLIPEAHLLPASQLSLTDGLAVYEYINSTKEPTAYISPVMTELGMKPAPVMASFSSQGPNNMTSEILKPDITAPGQSILASFTEAPGKGPSHMPFDTRRVAFNIDSGTSMAAPHVAGICGLLKKLHPHWSPAAIRSAVMTTASTRDNKMEPILNERKTRATPFNYGAGHVRPNSAMDPGLVYDLTPNDYLNFLCAIGYNQTTISLFSQQPYKCPSPAISLLDFNYPSITVPKLSGSATVRRTLKNVGSSPATYKVKIRPPSGISVSVEPEILKFDSVGQEKTFKLTLETKRPGYAKDYVFGNLKWSDGIHHVKSQIVVLSI
ncbi:subtilisin-like protease SBT5.4 [Macadamia integrifolia]|uniref:subtilisin-like protease SBT5.4 n=1 Tax=Macadamia integrifolia TaxID=60698 RepID=UPI001C529CC0|nr:subtilisin-like protease SBT5.4 [Macadamia integrifolia]